jgi:pyridoxal phosphate enzyme (YggS family)
MSIAQNIGMIIDNMKAAAAGSNLIRADKNVKLVAVTKNHTVEVMREALAAGIVAIGENRVQEAASKSLQLKSQAEWHLIGHLQTNKVRQAVPLFDLIHSVDSEHLAVEIDRVARKCGKRQSILLQVNVAGEDTKFGTTPAQVFALSRFISRLENVQLAGVMTIAPHYDEAENARPVFRELYQIFMELKNAALPNTNIEWLSMGMTDDYRIAIEEGANLVRIGTGIFGQRQYH